MKFIIIFYFIFNTCISFSTEAIRITNGEWPPFTSENAKDYGFVSKIVSDVFLSENIKVTYGFFPWVRGLELAKDNQWDGAIGWAKTKEREKFFYFSKKPVYTGKVVLFHLKDVKVSWKKMDDLKKFKIGVTTGYSYGKPFDDFILKNPQNIETVSADLNNFKKLLAGRIDIFPMDLDVGMLLLKNNFPEKECSQFTYNPIFLDERPQYLLLNKNAKNKLIMEKFDKAFEKSNSQKKINDFLEEFRKVKNR